MLENHLILAGPDHPACQPEYPGEDEGNRLDRIYEAWRWEQYEASKEVQ